MIPSIIAQDPDPELRREREELFARHPWLRYVVVVACLVAVIAIAVELARIFFA